MDRPTDAPVPDPRVPDAGVNDPGERRDTRAPSRRLERPPAERYASDPAERGPASAEGEPTRDRAEAPVPASAGRSVAIGAAISLAGATALVVLGGLMAFSGGLLAVAAIMGWAIGRTLATRGPARETRRRTVAVVLAADGVALAQVGLWLVARNEGGVLPLLDYLAQTWGVLVPLELVAGSASAWLAAR